MWACKVLRFGLAPFNILPFPLESMVKKENRACAVCDGKEGVTRIMALGQKIIGALKYCSAWLTFFLKPII